MNVVLADETIEPEYNPPPEGVTLEDLSVKFNGVPLSKAISDLNATITPEEMRYISPEYDEDGNIIEGTGDGRIVNEAYYHKYGIVVFGAPEPGPKTAESGENRYLGYNLYGEKVSNFTYPYDIEPPAGANFSNYNWYSNPTSRWQVTTAYTDVTGNGYNSADYIDHFLYGIELQHGDFYEADSSVDWASIFHVVTPPTEHTNGLARLWFESVSLGVRYIDVVLVADIITYNKANITITHEGSDVTNNASSPITVSEQNQESVVVNVSVNIDNLDEADRLSWYRDGVLWHETSTATLSFPDTIPFGTTSISYSVTATALPSSTDVYDPVVASTYISIIDHEEEELILYLEYDELSKDFSYTMNEGKGIKIDYYDPPSDGKWHEVLSAELDVSVQEKNLINDDLEVFGVNAYGDRDTNQDTISPYMTFSTERLAFGDDPENGNYKAKGEYEESFTISASGSEDRMYIPDGYAGSTLPAITASFSPTINTNVKIIAKTYNGNSIGPYVPVTTGETVVHEETSRGFEWQGDTIPFNVYREMKEADSSLIEIEGQYTRYYKPSNYGSVVFTPQISMFYDRYRDSATDPADPVVGIHINAPYTTTSDAKADFISSGKHTVKSGYFYTIQGKFHAIVDTTIYVTPGGDTGHDAIVDSVRNSFKVITNIPTVLDPNDRSSYLPYFENGSGTINVDTSVSKETTSNPLSTGAYSDFMELSPSFSYEELFRSGNVVEVKETSVITFDIVELKRYISIDAEDGDYYMLAYLNGFSIPESIIFGSHSGNLDLDDLPKGAELQANNQHYYEEKYIYNFMVKGNMYEDTNQQ